MAETVAETARLRLRDWDDADETRFYEALNTPAVMRHLGGVQTPDEWRSAFDRIRGFTRDSGHTFWIVEDKAAGELLGFCGLKRVNTPGAGELTGMPEIGWRLREDAWGQGYAREAAEAALAWGWANLDVSQIVAITVPANRRSRGLMERLGMVRRADLDFAHPGFAPDHALSRHITYTIGRP